MWKYLPYGNLVPFLQVAKKKWGRGTMEPDIFVNKARIEVCIAIQAFMLAGIVGAYVDALDTATA